MKTKLIFWGLKSVDETTEKVLIALELHPVENLVESWVFEGENANETLADQLMNNWRKGEVIVFPEVTAHQKNELSASGTIIPAGYTVEKEDLIKRTHTEWLFIVLSTKLYKTYELELSDIRDRVDGLKKYSKEIWMELKSFQEKIQKQVEEQNLFRDHTNQLRDILNDLFGTLKEMRQKEDNIFEAAAKETYDKMASTLNLVEDAVEKNLGEWAKWFDKLKGLQQEIKNVKLTKEGRNELWSRIDKAFKDVKDKRFGNAPANDENVEQKLKNRIEGLREAIHKMDDSVKRDEKELDFQQKKLDNISSSQLETQLREVKAKMIQDRLNSKREKLADMNKTLADLEAKLTRVLAKSATKEELKETEEKVEIVEVDNPVEEINESLD